MWFEIEPCVGDGPVTVLIRWRGYMRGLVLSGPAMVACTKVSPTDELPVITADVVVNVTAGVGARDDAADINRYWFPEAEATSEGLSDQAMMLLLGQHGRTIEDYHRFLTAAD